MINWNDVIDYAKNGNPKPDRRVEKSDEDWRSQLTPEQFYITREKGTEKPFSGEFCQIYKPGLYGCVCCQTLLFDSRVKFDSKTGWPSFTAPIKDNAIKYQHDDSFGRERVEVMCNVCDAHQGHVFPDGPPPSGLRYCINSVSIAYVDQENKNDE